MIKKQLGQFYTTNYEYILQNMSIPDNISHIIEPFVGKGDLLRFIKNIENYKIELYDIEPKYNNTIQRDTLKNPPCYDNSFVLTNPPYLARNKNKNKDLYDDNDCNDLYKCFIKHLINSHCLGGIIIIPLNFICSIRKSDIELRCSFLQKFIIQTINIFEEKVFNDTSYSVCSIQFTKNIDNSQGNIIKTFIYPSKNIIDIILTSNNNYTIGGEIYNLSINNQYKIERATRLNKDNDNITNILVKCIDDNIDNRICLKIASDDERNKNIDNTVNLSARSYAVLIINKKMSICEQSLFVEKVNNFINEQRLKYNSLFLTNYRESNTIARKRISFELVFRICNYILSS